MTRSRCRLMASVRQWRSPATARPRRLASRCRPSPIRWRRASKPVARPGYGLAARSTARSTSSLPSAPSLPEGLADVGFVDSDWDDDRLRPTRFEPPDGRLEPQHVAGKRIRRPGRPLGPGQRKSAPRAVVDQPGGEGGVARHNRSRQHWTELGRRGSWPGVLQRVPAELHPGMAPRGARRHWRSRHRRHAGRLRR